MPTTFTKSSLQAFAQPCSAAASPEQRQPLQPLRVHYAQLVSSTIDTCAYYQDYSYNAGQGSLHLHFVAS